jgi:hypothetical protein
VIDTIHNHSYARLGLTKKETREEVHYHAEFLQGEGILDGGSNSSGYGANAIGYGGAHVGLIPSDSSGAVNTGGSFLVPPPMSYAEPLVFSMPTNNTSSIAGSLPRRNGLHSSSSGSVANGAMTPATALSASPLASVTVMDMDDNDKL